MVADIIRFSVLTIVTSLLRRSEGHYVKNLNLDFLCSSTETNAYVRDIPWDCSSYIICMNGQAIPTVCPHGKLYASVERNNKCEPAMNVDASRCVGVIWKYIQPLCQRNPTATIPDAGHCSQYYDCSLHAHSQEFMEYLLECPYPALFSTQTGACQDYRFVSCGERDEPKAPCDYFQYLQRYNCTGTNCISCKLNHPSCVGLMNGPQLVAHRNDMMVECERGRTVNIINISGATSSVASPASNSATALG